MLKHIQPNVCFGKNSHTGFAIHQYVVEPRNKLQQISLLSSRLLKSIRCVQIPSFVAFGFMAFHVKSKVIGSGEAAFADFTLEGLGPSVLSYVPGKLIRSSKSPLTAWKMTSVWLFSWNTQNEQKLLLHTMNGIYRFMHIKISMLYNHHSLLYLNVLFLAILNLNEGWFMRFPIYTWFSRFHTFCINLLHM